LREHGGDTRQVVSTAGRVNRGQRMCINQFEAANQSKGAKPNIEKIWEGKETKSPFDKEHTREARAD